MFAEGEEGGCAVEGWADVKATERGCDGGSLMSREEEREGLREVVVIRGGDCAGLDVRVWDVEVGHLVSSCVVVVVVD